MNMYQPPQGYNMPGYGAPTQQVVAPVPTRRVIRRVGVFSAMKVAAIMTVLFWLVLGLFFLVFTLCAGGLTGALGSAFQNQQFGFPNGGLATGFLGALIAYFVLLFLYTIGAAIVAAIYAWFYNLTAAWVGGLEVEIR